LQHFKAITGAALTAYMHATALIIEAVAIFAAACGAWTVLSAQ
jgi:hypothetical protein